ncbi:MAG: hypothetical protein HY068_10710 [Burkholderiales bacterium]|nr:hypothetical protein [Burkholderiales bacterium]
MSVINKMLRDLDARRAATVLPGREAQAGLTRDTATVKGDSAMARLNVPMGRTVFVALLLVLGGGATWWYYDQTPGGLPVPAKPPQAAGPALSPSLPPAAVASSAAAPATAQVAAPLGSQQLNQMLDQTAASSPQAAARLMPPLPSASAPVTPEQGQQMVQQTLRNTPGSQLGLPAQSPGLAYELQQQLAKPAPRLATAPTLAAPVNPPSSSTPATRAATSVPVRSSDAGSDTPALAARPDLLRKGRPSGEVATASVVAESATASQAHETPLPKAPPAASKANTSARQTKPSDVAPAVNPRLAAAQEAVSQARTLWNTGSREAALDAVRQAVAVAERAQASTPDPAALPAFQTLVRELARMELALGQVSQLLEQLVRLEPLLADQADLWAVRGNAAQRLGQHQESVHAYGMALKLRPGEPRWMLASAVSLALQGQLAAAAEQAEKARAAGPVSPEVLAYLRQLGVSLR